MVKESAEFIAGAKQASRQLVLKRPKLPRGFQGKVSKDRVREEGCREYDQLMEVLRTGWC